MQLLFRFVPFSIINHNIYLGISGLAIIPLPQIKGNWAILLVYLFISGTNLMLAITAQFILLLYNVIRNKFS